MKRVTLITGLAVLFLGSLALVAAEGDRPAPAMKDKPAARAGQGQGLNRQQRLERWMNQINKAYEAKDFQKMEQMINPPEPEPKPEEKRTLRKEVCDAFGIPEENLFIKSRKREIVNARQVYTYLVYTTPIKNEDPVQHAKRTSPVCLGKHIGKDHATVYHYENKVPDYYDTEVNIRTLVDRLRGELIDRKLDMPQL